MPMRNLGKSCVPIDSIIDLIPLCPPALPFALRRIFPTGRCRSSYITSRLRDGILYRDTRFDAALPLRLTKVYGFAKSMRLDDIVHSPSNAVRSSVEKEVEYSLASRSMHQNPILWRVQEYSWPGLPRPRIMYDTGSKEFDNEDRDLLIKGDKNFFIIV